MVSPCYALRLSSSFALQWRVRWRPMPEPKQAVSARPLRVSWSTSLLPGVRNRGTRFAIGELTIHNVNIARGSAADVWVIWAMRIPLRATVPERDPRRLRVAAAAEGYSPRLVPSVWRQIARRLEATSPRSCLPPDDHCASIQGSCGQSRSPSASPTHAQTATLVAPVKIGADPLENRSCNQTERFDVISLLGCIWRWTDRSSRVRIESVGLDLAISA